MNLSRGLVLETNRFESRQKLPNHAHENALFCLALRGGCNETYGRKRRVYEPSVLSFLPANQEHSLELYDAGMHTFSIEITPLFIKALLEYSLNLGDSFHCRGGVLALLHKKVYSEFIRLDDVSPVAIEGLILEMLAEVSRGQKGRAMEKGPRWLRQVVELLHERFSECLTVMDIASMVGVHPVHLSRVFREHYHYSIGDYIRRLRIEYASRQILTTNTPLIEIAVSTGFSDQSHFSRVFKSHMGMTPSEFRTFCR